MKHIFLSLIGFSFLPAQVKNHSLKIANDTARHLAESMYNFFTETLEKNYKATNEQKLYENFLTDFYNKEIKLAKDYHNMIDSASMGSIPDYRLKVLKVNKHKLVKINKKLFVRDFSHYYYFFAEFILAKPDMDSADIRKLINLNSNIPLVVPWIRHIKKPLLFPTFYEVPAVMIGRDRDIIKDIQRFDLKISSYIERNVQFTGEVHLVDFARALTWPDVKEDLQYKAVREVAAIIFWKFLCQQAGVEFHKPPKDFKLIYN